MRAPLPSRRDIDDIPAWAVIRAARELARRLTAELAPVDLTPVEFGVLAQLAASDGMSQADLARAVGVRPQSMTTLIDGLAGRNLLQRHTLPGRGRVSRFTLTGSGERLLAEAWPLVTGSERWFGDDDAATASLVQTLRPLLGSAERMPAPEADIP